MTEDDDIGRLVEGGSAPEPDLPRGSGEGFADHVVSLCVAGSDTGGAPLAALRTDSCFPVSAYCPTEGLRPLVSTAMSIWPLAVTVNNRSAPFLRSAA